MKRNYFILDLLRPENNDDQLLARFMSRHEGHSDGIYQYTEDDLTRMIEVAERIKRIAEAKREIRRQQ